MYAELAFTSDMLRSNSTLQACSGNSRDLPAFKSYNYMATIASHSVPRENTHLLQCLALGPTEEEQ